MSDGSKALRVAIGADHGGFELKEQIRAWLTGRGYSVYDCGTHDKTAVDYPKIARAVAGRIADGSADRGIIIDGAGIGSAMAANKVAGVRAALCYDVSSARNSREHNDANVLTLGARLIGPGLAEQIVETFLATDCTEERHKKRVAMIEAVADRPFDKLRDRGEPAAAEGPKTPPFDGLRDRGETAVPPFDGLRDRNAAAAMEKRLDELSPDDIQRIAERIRQLIGPAAMSAGACSCCGSDCHGHCAQHNPDTVRGLLGMGAGRIGNRLGTGPLPKDVAGYIDHTALKPETTADEVRKLCAEAAASGFATVCINPCWVKLAAECLKGSAVKVCSVVGFPLGANATETKVLEARRAIRDGAREIDMVINVGALKGRDDELVYRDIRGVVEACDDGRAISKVIIETALLSDDEKVRACQAAKRARADFVKTSTGFGPGGATSHDVALMSQAVAGTGMGVKASGGIRSFEDAKKMIEAGATRIGASAGVKIVKEAQGAPAPAGAPNPKGKGGDKY